MVQHTSWLHKNIPNALQKYFTIHNLDNCYHYPEITVLSFVYVSKLQGTPRAVRIIRWLQVRVRTPRTRSAVCLQNQLKWSPAGILGWWWQHRCDDNSPDTMSRTFVTILTRLSLTLTITALVNTGESSRDWSLAVQLVTVAGAWHSTTDTRADIIMDGWMMPAHQWSHVADHQVVMIWQISFHLSLRFDIEIHNICSLEVLGIE